MAEKRRKQQQRLGNFEHLEAKRLMTGDLFTPVTALPAQPASEVVAHASSDSLRTHRLSHDHHTNLGNDGAQAGIGDGRSGTANRMMCDAHPDDPVLAAEHCAAMNLARPEDATHRVVASGDWSDPTIWANETLPTAKSRVHIPAGTTVTVDRVDPTTYATLRIDGTLRFATNVNTELRVDTIVSSMGSRLEMGTRANPIQADVTARIIIADCGEIDRVNDPLALGRGAILHGSTVINGAEKTSWSTTSQALRGDRTLTLTTAPQGWRVGDSLVIAGTKMDATGEETATIESIDGNVVTLSTPLTLDHIPPATDLSVHVANTTRNAVIQSESTVTSRRGHIMFMHNPDVQIAYAGFYDLGRTDKSILPNPVELDENGQLEPGTGTNVQGRYSVHFHRQGVAANMPAARIEGSALIGSPGWGYVNHSSHVDIVDNVSFDVFGAAFYTEAGDEIGSFVNNLSIKTHGTGLPPNDRDGVIEEDFGHSGDGFWFQGGSGINIRGNVASGATGSGMIIYGVEFPVVDGVSNIPFLSENLPDPSLANGAATIPVGYTWLTEMTDNTAYGSVVGVQTFYHRSPISLDFDGMADQINQYKWDFPNSLIDNTTVWNSEIGVKANYNVDIHYRNVRILNASDQIGEIGFDVSNVYNNGEHIYENLEIRGFYDGLVPSPNGRVTIESGDFANETDIRLLYPRQDRRTLEIRGDINFAELPGDSPLQEDRVNIDASGDLQIRVDGAEHWFQYHDRVILNYGEYNGQELFREVQAASVVPFPEQPPFAEPDDPGEPIPEEFIGLTNGEMQAEFGASLGGVVPSADAVDAEDDGIIGLIGSAVEEPALCVPRLTLGSDEQLVDLGVEGLDGCSAGDFDHDTRLDLGDIDALMAIIAAGPNGRNVFDLNGDGVINTADRDTWLQLAGDRNLPTGNAYLLGDANLDGSVDVSDFNIWNTNKFSSSSAWSSGNFNGDSGVDISDFNVWNANKFQTALRPSAGVNLSFPEEDEEETEEHRSLT